MTMHQKPRRTLAKMLERYGDELIGDPRRTEALLNDLCGKYNREIFVLIQAQRRRVPAELRAAPRWMPLGTTVNRLAQQLEEQLALTPEAAAWAVDSWSIALGLRTEDAPAPWYTRLPQALSRASNAAGLPTPATADNLPKTGARLGGRKAASADRARQKPADGVKSTTKTDTSSSPHAASVASANAASTDLAAGKAALAPRRPKRGLNRFPAYLRKQAPNVLLWTTVFLTSLLLGWAAWDGAAVSLGLPTTNPVTEQTGADGSPGLDASGGTSPGDTGTTDAVPTPWPTGNALQGDPQLPVPGYALLLTLYAPPIEAVVTAEDGLNVRGAPGLDGPWLRLLGNGASVSVVGYSGDGRWAELSEPAGGWVSTEFLALAAQNGSPVRIRLDTGRISPQLAAIDLRATPRVDAAPVNQLEPGTEIIVIATSLNGEWLQIGAPDIGWVLSSAVEFYTPNGLSRTPSSTEPISTVPISTVPIFMEPMTIAAVAE